MAVDNPFVAVTDGSGASGPGIGAGLRLSQAKSTDLFATCQRDQEFSLLFLAAE